MKKLKTVTQTLSEYNNTSYTIYIPENSKILNTWIEKDYNTNLIFLIEYDSHLESRLHSVQIKSIVSYDSMYIDGYVYINTAIKDQLNIIPNTLGSQISFKIDVIKTYYHIYRCLPLEEIRDEKINNIIS